MRSDGNWYDHAAEHQLICAQAQKKLSQIKVPNFEILSCTAALF
jgi:hypothetical protein